MAEEYTETLAKLKASIEKEISELESRVSELKKSLKAINYFLVKASLKTADKIKKSEKNVENLLKSNIIGTLGEFNVTDNQIVFTPAQQLKVSVTAPSFKSFFIPKVLEVYTKEDDKLIDEGKLDPKNAFEYKIVEKNSIIENVMIRNYRTNERLRNIKKTLRWAVEKAVG